MKPLKFNLIELSDNVKNYDDMVKVQSLSVVAVKDSKILKLLPARVCWHMPSLTGSANVYCNFWLQTGIIRASGTGVAKGMGYCKISKSFNFALRSAGIELLHHRETTSTHDVQDVLEMLIKELGDYDDIDVIHS